MQAAMRATVDRFAANPGWQMAHAEGQVIEIEPPVLALRDPVDEAERSTWRRQVDLDAGRQARSVPCVLIAGEQGVYCLPLTFQPRAGFFTDPLALPVVLLRSFCQARSSNATGTNPRLSGTGLPLAVGGLHSPELSLELRERRGLVAQALHYRLGRRIGRNYEATVVASLLDNVRPLDIAAQFHVRLVHGVDDCRGFGCHR